MPLRLFGFFSITSLLFAVALLGGAARASAAGPIEGNFESGRLGAWSANSFYGENLWGVEPRAEAEAEFEMPSLPTAVGPFVAATKYRSTDTSLLSQTFALPAASNLTLSLYLFYKSETPPAVPSPDTLFVKNLGEPGGNQQVRVDVLKPNAPLESLSPNDILATLYASPNGGPTVLPSTLVSADLSAFAGQTVTLRVAGAVSNGSMIVGIGDASLAVSPLPPAPAVEPIAAGPLAGPIAGRLIRDRATGGGKLTVTVPAAGELTVLDARRKVAIASTFVRARPTASPNPILIRTAAIQVSGAQTLRVPLRPTAAAKKLLAKNGRLPFRLQMTFTATNGEVSTGTCKGILLRRLRPARR